MNQCAMLQTMQRVRKDESALETDECDACAERIFVGATR